jgi:hypothetical protein
VAPEIDLSVGVNSGSEHVENSAKNARPDLDVERLGKK